MYYTVYRITNLINNKIYIGVHRTLNLNDSYMGSGQNIKKAIKKYGKHNFKKEYIAIFDNVTDMFEMESLLVNKAFINNGRSYNLNEGGKAGFTYLPLDEMKKSFSNWGRWNNIEKRKEIWKCVPIEKRKEIAKTMGSKYGGRNKLSQEEINKRILLLKDIDFSQKGSIMKSSKILGISHTHLRRFINKYL